MPRKPASLELASGKGNRQRIWDAIRALDGAEWCRLDICTAARVELSVLESYMTGLIRAGFVVETRRENRPGAAKRVYYRLARDNGVEAPRVRRDGTPVTQGLAQEQMWRALRMLGADTNHIELSAHASTPEVPVHPLAARDYLLTLHTAGYLERTSDTVRNPHKPEANRSPRYRLIATRNTGPKPPMVCRQNVVFDANENRVVWSAVITEEDTIYES